MRYTYVQLGRIEPRRRGWLLWKARLGRVWKAYLRFASLLAGLFGAVILTLQYFIVLPPFAWMAKRAARKEPDGWFPVLAQAAGGLKREY